MEITISEAVAEKVLDSCVGVDNRRYYKVQWQTTWEPEEEFILKNQHLVEEFWKEASGAADIETGKNFLNTLFEKLGHGNSNDDLKDVQQIVNAENICVVDYNIGSFYKEVNSPEHKISNAPPPSSDSPEKPPPLSRKVKGEIRPFKCDQCVRSYPTEKKLKDHKRKLHTNIGTYQCSMCSKLFTTKRNLQQHMNRHTGVGPHACPGCSKRFMAAQEVETHKRSCNSLVEKEFQCDICSKRFATKTHLSFHTKIHLPDSEKPFKCLYCPRTFAYNHDCVHHMRLHIGEKPFKCQNCGAAFHRKSYLTEHMFVHTGISKYRCEDCLEYFKTQQMLQTHVKNIHILKKKPLSVEEKDQLKESKKMKKKLIRYKCEECDKEFRFLKEFHYHQAVNHKEAIQTKKTDNLEFSEFEPTMVYKCKKCEKTFSWPSALKKHAETHRSGDLIDKHTESYQSDDLIEKCIDVVASLERKEQTANINALSEEQSKKENSECAKKNVQIEINEAVQPVIMNIERTYSCRLCFNTFVDEMALNVHMVERHPNGDTDTHKKAIFSVEKYDSPQKVILLNSQTIQSLAPLRDESQLLHIESSDQYML